MPVGIAEINALAAARPSGPAFDGDAFGLEPLLPGRELVGRNRKGDVHRAVPVMRRDGAAGKAHGFERAPAQEEKQHAARADVVGAKPLIAVDAVEPQHLLVERAGALELFDIERGFKNAEQVGHVTYSFASPPAGTWAVMPRTVLSTRHHRRTIRAAMARSRALPECRSRANSVSGWRPPAEGTAEPSKS